MGNDKYDFILELIESKKLNTSQKERVLLLTAKEMKKEGKVIDERLRKIERLLESNDEKNEKKEFKPIKKTRSSIEPNPKHVADFMSLFNQRNGLKYLTHDFDEDGSFDIDSFLVTAHKVFEESTNKLNIPQSLWIIVKQFAFDSKHAGWTSITEDYKKNIPIKIGWATKELRDWSKQNHLHPIRNKEYRRMIANFKRIIRIEDNSLEKLATSTLDDIFQNELDDFSIEKKDLEKADFYSHVGFLKSAFEAIFEEIKKHSDSPEKKKISLKYERSFSDEGYYLRKVIITHYNSFPSKELKLLLEEWQVKGEKGNMGKIREKLRGYCHWSVETMIEGSPTRVNILRDKNMLESEIVEKNVIKGFTHILTFYYK